MVCRSQLLAVGIVKNGALAPLMLAVPTVRAPAVLFFRITVLLTVPLEASVPKSIAVKGVLDGAKVAVNGVVLFCTALLALSIPAPQFLLVAQSQASQLAPNDGKAVIESGVLRMFLTWAGVRAGFFDNISATAAATCGVAMLVP